MELKEYLRIIKKHLFLILACALITTTGGYLFARQQSTKYEAVGDITVVPQGAAELKNVYEYDGYYALQAATIFTTTISSWLASPDSVMEIYQKAGLDIKGQTSKSLSKFIKTTPVLNSVALKFQLQTASKENTLKLAKGVNELVKEKTETFNQTAGSKTKFSLNLSEPLIIENRPPVGLITLCALVVGAVLGIFLAFLKEYLRS